MAHFYFHLDHVTTESCRPFQDGLEDDIGRPSRSLGAKASRLLESQLSLGTAGKNQ